MFLCAQGVVFLCAQGVLRGQQPIADPRQVITISAPWRFHPGAAQPGCAGRAFDDSSWTQVSPNQLLTTARLPADATDGWARLHLRLPPGARTPLGIALDTHSGQQIVVYANGSLLGASRGALEGFQQRNTPFVIALPAADDLLLAVHILPRKTIVEPRFPLTTLRLGPLSALSDAIELERIRLFDAEWLTAIFAGLVYLSFVPIAFTLFVARQDRREYLWLGIFCLVGFAYMAFSVADAAGVLPETLPNKIFYIYSGVGTLITGLEFVGIFVAVRRWLPIRVFQALMAATPVLFFAGRYALYNVALAAALLAWIVGVTCYLVAAFRRGQAESGLLLVPFACIPLFTFLTLLQNFFPRVLRVTRRMRVGHIGVGLDDLASVLFIFGILGIVLYRFVRVSRDEQRAAAELEAARNVQQVLIPVSEPGDISTVPGYRIASVYLPALQVGGDFFQVIPIPQGTLVILGDVSGKGLQAAMTVAVIVGGIRALANYTQSPAALLSALNRLLCGRGSGFTTCVILRLEPVGQVIASTAGHLAPYRAGEELTLPPGLPLGVIAEAEYIDLSFHLPPAATLTLLTDGVVEAANPATRELFGFARTRNLSTQSAAFIADAARAFGPPNAQDDDITVLTIARTALP